jgi:predicted RNA-binding Zn-ribbon protein involved in translation (DUF1610 family)
VVCSNCGFLNYYTDTVIDPTCTNDGFTRHDCSNCGATIWTDNYVPALGHNYVSGVCTECGDTESCVHEWVNDGIKTNPTCTDPGEMQFECIWCGETKTEPIPAYGHNYVETVIAPTCGSDGYTEHKCSNCGDTYTDSTVPATGLHTLTYTQEGANRHTENCSVCGYSAIVFCSASAEDGSCMCGRKM